MSNVITFDKRKKPIRKPPTQPQGGQPTVLSGIYKMRGIVEQISAQDRQTAHVLAQALDSAAASYLARFMGGTT